MAYRLVQTLNSGLQENEAGKKSGRKSAYLNENTPDFINSSIGPQKYKKGGYLNLSNVCPFCLT